MWKPYSIERTEQIITKMTPKIETVAQKYGMPAAALKAVLRKEMPQINWIDFAADLAVACGGILGRPERGQLRGGRGPGDL